MKGGQLKNGRLMFDGLMADNLGKEIAGQEAVKFAGKFARQSDMHLGHNHAFPCERLIFDKIDQIRSDTKLLSDYKNLIAMWRFEYGSGVLKLCNST